MTTKVLLFIALGAAGMAPLSAQQAEPAAAAVEVTANAAHPFIDWELYPRWSQLTPEQGVADVRYGLQEARKNVAALCAVKPEEATYENTFGAYERLMQKMDDADTLFHHLSSVLDSPAMREAEETLIPERSAFAAELNANEQLWKVIKHASTCPWVKQLSPEKQRYVQQVVDSFKDSGADLSPEQKKQLAKLHEEASKLSHKFSKNVLDSTNAWQLVITDKSKLAGMSDAWLEKAAAKAAEKGFGTPENPQYMVTLDPTSVIEVLKNCECAETRKLCWEGRLSVGKNAPYDNEPIVARMMEVRREIATLLGFGTYADLTTARRMVGSGDNAMAFVDGMMRKVKPSFDRETAELMEYASKKSGKKIEKFDPWDIAYYSHQYSKELYSFDPESLRPYQEADNVRRGMFSIASHLYDINFREVPTAYLEPGQELPEGKVEVWHPEVRLFEVHDNKTGAHLGSFYIDLYPRATKRAGAWVLGMRHGEPAANGKPHSPHLATICGNLSAPTADKPALFSHYDVETLFHEFGHMMHQMLGDSELISHMGTSVAWDFVELPSQLNENWTWEPAGISTYARHYETGEPLPDELMKKMLAGRYFMPATDNMNQLRVAKIDLEIHTRYNEEFKGRPLDEASYELLSPWSMPTTQPAPSIFRSLTHCMCGGYSAGYYSYKWAEVLAADAFTRFKNEGVMNEKTGASFRECILSKGDSKPAAELFRDFMGRDPNPDALLQSQGLTE